MGLRMLSVCGKVGFVVKIYDKCCEWLEIVIKSYKKREL